MLYSTFTAYLGFNVNEDEYKVMGLAAYGQPTLVEQVRKLISRTPDGAFALDLDYFEFHTTAERCYSSRFVELFGPRSSIRLLTIWRPIASSDGWRALLNSDHVRLAIAASLRRLIRLRCAIASTAKSSTASPSSRSRTLETRGRDRGIDNRTFVIRCHQRNRFSVLVASSTNTTPRPGTSVSPNKAPEPGGLPVLSSSTLKI